MASSISNHLSTPIGINSLPAELLRRVGDHFTVWDLTSLLRCCKKTYVHIGGQYYFEKQIQDELDFDAARVWLKQYRFRPNRLFYLNAAHVASWPESRALLFSDRSEGARRLFHMMDDFFDRWGAGVLYFNCSTTSIMWERTLCRRLPKYHRVGSLINRAISSCPDTRILAGIMESYVRLYPLSLLGRKDAPFRGRFVNANAVNDLPPVFWAYCENRVEALELLNRKTNDTETHWLPIDIDLLTCEKNLHVYGREPTAKWYEDPPKRLDAWECAFHPLNSTGHRKKDSISEDACLWLLHHRRGFCSRPGGIPLQHLAEAAVLNKIRLVRALLVYFRLNIGAEALQRAVYFALRTIAQAWVGPRQSNQSSHTQTPDESGRVIHELFDAVKGYEPLHLKPVEWEALQCMGYQG